MKILIVGSNGQLGTELLKCFAERRTELGVPRILTKDNVIDSADIDTLDISDLAAVTEYVEKGGYECVINCAAYTNVDGCEENIETAFSANAIGPRNLAIACEKTGAKLIHVSTDYVFSGDGNAPYIEWDVCNPMSAYGKSKLLGEKYVQQFCKKYFIVRTAWLYGYNGKNFVKTIVRVAREKKSLKVVNDQVGNPTNAADLAHHILLLIDSNEYGVYHGTCNGICSWYDFACEIVKQFGIDAEVAPCTSAEYPSKVKRPSYSALRNTMFERTVGDSFRDWKDALKCYAQNAKL